MVPMQSTTIHADDIVYPDQVTVGTIIIVEDYLGSAEVVATPEWEVIDGAWCANVEMRNVETGGEYGWFADIEIEV